MKSKVITIILIISLGINIGLLASYVYQQLTGKRIEERDVTKRGWRRGRLRHKLKLDEDQLKKAEAMQETTYLKINPIRDTLKIRREELANLLKNSQLDKSKLQNLIKEIANLQAEIEFIYSEQIWQMKKVLSPEQQQQFFKLFNGRLRGKKMFGLSYKESKHKHRGNNKYQRKGGRHDY
jgi:Spy/CpxP family protein refolding chaperone